MTRKALGRGIKALIPEDIGLATMRPTLGLLELSVEEIKRNHRQPRSSMNERALEELADSVRQRGVLQPVVVRRTEGGYELVAGERRFLACKKAGLKKIPAVLKEAGEEDMMELALIENLQREDLNPVDEARAYRTLMSEFFLTQEELAAKVGKDRSSVANCVRLLNLPDAVLDMVGEGTLSSGHARALLALGQPSEQVAVARKAVGKGMSVRETEAFVNRLVRRRGKGGYGRSKPPEVLALEERLRNFLATNVRISWRGRKGKVEIDYYGHEELERILEVMGVFGQEV
ncbi:MAG: ParB/RepB/Spo0J family partition protein [Candidatus Eiseniibacteriota bacterium]|nr:MAG: ParB/RepB/Spo0J family partition protein [Candidatus Eisenbacteria bacterium]